MSGISPDGAAAAEEHARSRQSRWWLKGNDPNHPSLQGSQGSTEATPIISSASNSAENPKTNESETSQVAEENGDDQAQADDENDSDAASIQAADETLDDDGSNAPIMARDDDLGSSFGTLSNFGNRQNASKLGIAGISAGKEIPAAMEPLRVASLHSPLLPSWLSPLKSPESSPEVFKQEFGSSEEMLKSYSSYPTLTTEKKDPILLKSPVAVAQVTSESDADYSIHSSSLSSTDDSTIYPKPSYQGIDTKIVTFVRSRKRVRTDCSSILGLDETYLEARIQSAKSELLSKLENEGTGPAFQCALKKLEKYSKLKASTNKKRKTNAAESSADSTDIDGTWLMASPPEYPSCLGKNEDGESLFTLGRMSFDMYQPADLVCSIQKQYNTITSVDTKDLPQCVPKSLRKEVQNERNRDGSGRLKTYNIVASFTIEDSGETSSTQKLRGIMTNYGYALPDPVHPDRKSIWFSGGTIEPADDDQLDQWMKIFGSTDPIKTPEDVTSKNLSIEAEMAKSLASRILLGAVSEPVDDNGTVGFHLNKPIGGHGSAFVDVVYMDDELRVMRGNAGSIYVFKRA